MKPLSENLKEIVISNYGLVKVKGFSISDEKYILMIKETKDDEEFTKKTLLNQIVEPEITMENLNNLDISDVYKIIQSLNPFVNNNFIDVKPDENMYGDFREKLLIEITSQLEHAKELSKSFEEEFKKTLGLQVSGITSLSTLLKDTLPIHKGLLGKSNIIPSFSKITSGIMPQYFSIIELSDLIDNSKFRYEDIITRKYQESELFKLLKKPISDLEKANYELKVKFHDAFSSFAKFSSYKFINVVDLDRNLDNQVFHQYNDIFDEFNKVEFYNRKFYNLYFTSDNLFKEFPVSIIDFPSKQTYLSSRLIKLLFINQEEQSVKSDLNLKFIEISVSNESDLILLLDEMDKNLKTMYIGARDSISINIEDKTRHYMISKRELINNILRILAPDDCLMRWIEEEKISELGLEIIDEKGNPTKKGRLLYICRNLLSSEFKEYILEDISTLTKYIRKNQGAVHRLDLFENEDILLSDLELTKNLIVYLIKISFLN